VGVIDTDDIEDLTSLPKIEDMQNLLTDPITKNIMSNPTIVTIAFRDPASREIKIFPCICDQATFVWLQGRLSTYAKNIFAIVKLRDFTELKNIFELIKEELNMPACDNNIHQFASNLANLMHKYFYVNNDIGVELASSSNINDKIFPKDALCCVLFAAFNKINAEIVWTEFNSLFKENNRKQAENERLLAAISQNLLFSDSSQAEPVLIRKILQNNINHYDHYYMNIIRLNHL
jgi:hypothetical protein